MIRLLDEFIKAKSLRKRGYSLNEISKRLNISKSTASIWLKNCNISEVALKRLEKRKNLGRLNSGKVRRAKREKQEEKIKKEVIDYLNFINIKKEYLKLFCSLLYICEGSKNIDSRLSFCNSDPLLIKTFLNFLRFSFKIDEDRFRVSLHIHEYHSSSKQISFWSRTTRIPKSQFIKPYIKPHTGKRKKDNYQGCVNIRYCDSLLSKKLLFLGKELLYKYGDVG